MLRLCEKPGTQLGFGPLRSLEDCLEVALREPVVGQIVTSELHGRERVAH